jgi:hypothetical protein
MERYSFTDWNYMVRGLIEVWELARLSGVTEKMQEKLHADSAHELAHRLAKIGNEYAALQARPQPGDPRVRQEVRSVLLQTMSEDDEPMPTGLAARLLFLALYTDRMPQAVVQALSRQKEGRSAKARLSPEFQETVH